MVFRRRRQRDAEGTPDADVDPYDGYDEPVPPDEAADAEPDPPAHGPWDMADLEDPANGRVDLGGLLIPAVQGMELRAEIADDQVVAATVVIGDSLIQLQPFAAPRSQGIWDEIRGELAASVTKQGGTVDEGTGPFGAELRVRVSVSSPDGKKGTQPARFVGVDGPRWFLRAVITGRGAREPGAARRVEEMLRDVVVVRGGSPMAPRDPIPLRLPQDADTGPTDTGGADGPQRSPLDPFRRGPEITEVR